MPTLINLEELIPRVHAAARAKGFWDDVKPNASQFLMLTIGELGECQEAHRKAFRADLRDFNIMAASDPNAPTSVRAEIEAKAFIECVKDTVEDELADAYIRICDIVAGFVIGDERVIRSRNSWHPMLADNFGECLLDITRLLANLSSQGRISTLNTGEALAYLEHLAAREEIDLSQHIELKLRYNLSRPVRHGKSY